MGLVATLECASLLIILIVEINIYFLLYVKKNIKMNFKGEIWV